MQVFSDSECPTAFSLRTEICPCCVSPALVVPRHIVVPLVLCTVPPKQLDRAVAAETTCALHTMSSPATPQRSPYKDLRKLMASASLCIPGAILSQGRIAAGKQLPQRHPPSEEKLRHVPKSLTGCPEGRAQVSAVGVYTGSMGCPSFLGSFPVRSRVTSLIELAPKPWGNPRQWPCHALFWSQLCFTVPTAFLTS